MNNLPLGTPRTCGSPGSSAGRTSIVLLVAIAILGVSTVSGSLLYQWQRSGALRETRIDPLVEQQAKAALTEAGFLVITDPRTGYVDHVHFLQSKQLDDATMQRLAALRHVGGVNLYDTNLTDRQLGHLRGLTDLRWLLLADTGISDEGVASLAAVPELAALYLAGTKVSNDGLQHLAGLRNLWALDVRDTLVTEEGLKHLQGMDQLQTLMLTEITDAGVPYLMEMPNLKLLSVNRNKLSEAGLRQLRQHVPGLAIHCTAAK